MISPEDAPEGAGIHDRGVDDLARDVLVEVAEDEREERHGQHGVDQGDAPDGPSRSSTQRVITISGIMMIWNGTKAQMKRRNRKVWPSVTFQSASA